MKNTFKKKYSDTGYWMGNLKKGRFDKKLVNGILEYIDNNDSLIDFGCGKGRYVEYFYSKGIETIGYDGNPLTNDFCKLCYRKDLSKKIWLGKQYDWVLSLEVGEHIPKQYEDNFIHNLHVHNKKGIILSWARPRQGGIGHVNCVTQDYLKTIFIDKMGYKCDTNQSKYLSSICELPWLSKNIIVFTK